MAIGGFHVSGCLAMLKELPPELREAMDSGISLFAGELEGRLEGLLQDLMAGGLKPLYNYLTDLPDMSGTPTPILPADRVALTMGRRASFDAGRGCPYLCSFCTIINVQGRKSRHRTADDVERLVRANFAQGITNFFITDDNFARNANWESIFDRIIALRGEGIELQLVIQVDTQSHRIARFIEKAGQAGVTRAFLGMENINPDSLKTAQKGQNKITDYRAMLQAWHAVGVLTYAGYILGFPEDTPETIRRDLAIIQRELPVDILEFFILTPLPGSKDHQRLAEAGVAMDSDMNNYDTQHVVTAHPRMTKAEWEGIFREAWDLYYSPEHVATVLRRCRVWGYDPKHMMGKLFAFHAPMVFEGTAPAGGGPDPHQAPARPPPRASHRVPPDLLSQAGLRVRAQVRRGLCHAQALQAHPEAGPGGAGGGLHGRGHGPGGAGGGGSAGTVHRHRGRPAVRGQTPRPGGAARRGRGSQDLAALREQLVRQREFRPQEVGAILPVHGIEVPRGQVLGDQVAGEVLVELGLDPAGEQIAAEVAVVADVEELGRRCARFPGRPRGRGSRAGPRWSGGPWRSSRGSARIRLVAWPTRLSSGHW